MYNNDFVVCIKVDGKILREEKDIVRIPYGTEYSILLKNLRNEKALVTNLQIDGQDVLNSNQLIINGKDNLELERFLGKDLNKGNKFKWIEKTEKISNHRGDKPEDGLISVEFQFEKKIVYNDVIYRNNWIYESYPYCPIQYPTIWNNTGGGCTAKGVSYSNYDVVCSAGNTFTTSDLKVSSNVMRTCSLDSFDFNENGITTKGSISEQKFTYGIIGELEDNKYTITLQLKGKNKNNENVSKIVSINEKIECKICGTKNTSKNNFCSECGTYLK